MSRFYVAISAYRQEKGKLPLASPAEVQDLGAVAATVSEVGQYPPLTDGWGRPYHLALDLDGDGTVSIGNRKVECGFLMWSEGPNRVDDGCTGDDFWLALPL